MKSKINVIHGFRPPPLTPGISAVILRMTKLESDFLPFSVMQFVPPTTWFKSFESDQLNE
jgi:hypothetical protein